MSSLTSPISLRNISQEFCNATNSYGVQAVKLLAPAPTVTACGAATDVIQGTSNVNLTINGTGFYDPPAGLTCRVPISASVSGTGVTVNGTTFVSTTQVTVNISVAGGATTGARTITITNPDGQTAATASCLNILDADYGDAPDTYSTLLASNGPRHGNAGARMGTARDFEPDGQPNATATGDGADEDGVTFPTMTAGTTVTIVVRVTASGSQKLDAFLDLNADGDFADSGEKIFDNLTVNNGNNNLNYSIPPTATNGATFARFRLSATGGVSFNGVAPDGEVEDYQTTIVGACTPPTTSNAGPDQTLCVTSPTATLAANTSTTGTGAWSVVTAPGGGSTASSQFSNTASPTSTFTPSPAVAGAYTLRWTITAAGCPPPSTDDVMITYTAAPSTSNAGPDQTLCVTSPTATLAANTPTSGTGAWSVVTAPGGGSTASSQFSNTASPTSTFTPSPVVAGAYTLRWTISNSPCTPSTDDVVITYNATPTTSNAGTDQTLCTSSPAATLAANTPTNGTGAWSVVTAPGGGSTAASQFSNTASPTSTFTPSPAVAGAYTLRWTISTAAPCTDSTDDVVITYNAAPTTANAGPDQTTSLCVTTPATLAANTPSSGTGAWSVVSGPSTASSQFNNTSDPTATFTPAVAGTYNLRWTITNAPCTASTDDVLLVFYATPTTANAGSDQTICATGSATLAANTPSVGTGSWSVVSGPSLSSGQFSNTTSPTSTFTPAGGDGTYTLRWTITAIACPASTDDVVIAVNAPPTTANAGPDQTTSLCVTTPATLAANTPSSGTGTWSVVTSPGGLGGTFTPNANAPNATFTPAGGSGSYTLRWTISTGAPCPDSTDDVLLIFFAAPTTSNAGADQTICSTGSATLAANLPSVGSGTWSVVSGPNTSSGQFSNPTSPASTFTPAGGAGVYTLRWTITNPPCPPSNDSVVITFNGPPTTANAGADQTICSTGTATLAANAPAIGVGVWSVVSGPSTSSGQFSNPALRTSGFTPAGGAGVYTLRWTISNVPCASTFDDVAITAQGSCTSLGLLFAADTQNHRIQRFDGLTWTVLVGNGVSGTAVNQCNLPKAVTASNDGQRIYVSDTGNNRITFSTNGGTTWAIFASTGIGLSQVRGPQGLALDAAGNLYVADALNERVLRFAGGLPGTAVVLASSGFGAGQVKSPRGLAADATGNLYVTDRVNHRLMRIANAATVVVANTGVMVNAGQGLTLSHLNGPEGVTVDAAGNVYVADALNERIIQFPGGVTPGVVMSDGAGTTLGKVSRPEGVTLATFSAGPLAGQPFLIVSDTMNSRIQGRPTATPIWQLIGAPNGLGSGVGQFRIQSQVK